MHSFNDLQRMSTSPKLAAKFWIEFGNVDVLDLLPRVTVSTLVLHSRHDAMIPFQLGRQLAALIPGARFVPLESKNHILLENERRGSSSLLRFTVLLGWKITTKWSIPISLIKAVQNEMSEMPV